jgi:hypothetical protein
MILSTSKDPAGEVGKPLVDTLHPDYAIRQVMNTNPGACQEGWSYISRLIKITDLIQLKSMPNSLYIHTPN